MQTIPWLSVTALLLAGAALATVISTAPAPTQSAASAPAQPPLAAAGAPAKPAATAPTVAQVKALTPEQLKARLCSGSADEKKLAGEIRKRFLADCLKAP